MKRAPQPLPMEWVEKIFEKLMLTYGADFHGRWAAMGEKGLLAAKNDWAWELGGFADHPDAIFHALTILPAKAPNVIEFRALARLAPLPEFKQLDRPRADPAKVAEQIAKQTQLKQAMVKTDPKAWAKSIIQRHRAGEKVLPYTLNCAKQALGIDGRMAWQ